VSPTECQSPKICKRCGRAARRPAPPGQRRRGAAEEYFVRGLCPACYTAVDRAGERYQWPLIEELAGARRADEVLDEWHLIVTGSRVQQTRKEIAKRMGMNPSTLSRAISRARARGDRRAVHHWQRLDT
jgi:hypothetical protein